jgi:very-short-patch-repair endonuclease
MKVKYTMASKKAPVKKTKLLTNDLVERGRSQPEEQTVALLRVNFPGIKIVKSDKSVLGRQEIDIHLVDYKIAIEVDGISHTSPIYGAVRFAESQERDARKEARLTELGFLLYRIDISKYTKENMYTELKAYMNTTLIPELKRVIPSRSLSCQPRQNL